MADALIVPHAVAAIVLCVAGLAKLRSPATAAQALTVPTGLVRAFAVYELALGAVALASSAAGPSVLLGLTYLALAALMLVLARRSAACGCFGEGPTPASVAQSVLSLVVALAAFAAAIAGSAGIGWILERPVGSAAVLLVGIVGAAYGTVVAYSELPLAWRAWSVS